MKNNRRKRIPRCPRSRSHAICNCSGVFTLILSEATSKAVYLTCGHVSEWRSVIAVSYRTGKTVHVHAKHYKHNEDGLTAPGVCGHGSVPLSHSGNVVTRIGLHTSSVYPCVCLFLVPGVYMPYINQFSD